MRFADEAECDTHLAEIHLTSTESAESLSSPPVQKSEPAPGHSPPTSARKMPAPHTTSAPLNTHTSDFNTPPAPPQRTRPSHANFAP
ncbi:hypothetical protein JTE90_004054 [Oedothorax gibbosus]|uniref:Uncharacterized protein n=1 Tax=Oedothorax gibbosus TaxID=931172 RepID=A0AAV6U5L8_9ARAC|nr:hypothetical protein JTE90_004054 [Oedothorax gibbosus]